MALVAGTADKLHNIQRTPAGNNGKRQLWTIVAIKDPLIGQLLASRFQLLEIIGQGAMAVVYKAKQTAVDRFVAVKIMRPELAKDPIQQKRFAREARSLSKLDHPNLLKIFDIGQTPTGRPYFIMEYLKGRSIEKMLEENGPVVPSFALKMFVQVCDAMDYAHRQGIIHRDLKPENIMLVRCEEDQHLTKVVDFGIVKYTDDQMVSQRLTKSGEVWGSPVYMSPEQCMGNTLDPRTDIYSLGLVMYEALTGELAIGGNKIGEIVVKQINEMPKPFKQIRPDLSIDPQLEAIIFKALEKDASKRYQTMAEMRTVLKRAQDAEAKRTQKQSGSYVVANTSQVAAQKKTGGNNPQVSPTRTTANQQEAPAGRSMVPVMVLGAIVVTFMVCATAFAGFMFWRSAEDAKARNSGGAGGGGTTVTTDKGGDSKVNTVTSTPPGGDVKSVDAVQTTTTTTVTSNKDGTTVSTSTQKKHRPRRRHSNSGGGGGHNNVPSFPRSDQDYLDDFRNQPN